MTKPLTAVEWNVSLLIGEQSRSSLYFIVVYCFSSRMRPSSGPANNFSNSWITSTTQVLLPCEAVVGGGSRACTGQGGGGRRSWLRGTRRMNVGYLSDAPRSAVTSNRLRENAHDGKKILYSDRYRTSRDRRGIRGRMDCTGEIGAAVSSRAALNI